MPMISRDDKKMSSHFFNCRWLFSLSCDLQFTAPKMDFFAAFCCVIIVLLLLHRFLKGYFHDLLRSIKLLLTMNFEMMDTLVEEDVVYFGALNLKFALVNDPNMIHKVLSSEVCLEKPRLVYKLLGTKYSLVSEPSNMLGTPVELKTTILILQAFSGGTIVVTLVLASTTWCSSRLFLCST